MQFSVIVPLQTECINLNKTCFIIKRKNTELQSSLLVLPIQNQLTEAGVTGPIGLAVVSRVERASGQGFECVTTLHPFTGELLAQACQTHPTVVS